MASQSDCKDAELYRALMDKKKSEVLRLYTQFPDGAFHRLTIHDDTVLHMALHSSQVELVLELLRQLPASDIGKIRTAKNTVGNTLLHEAATNDSLVVAAKEIIRLNPFALFEENDKFGERAPFRAARYGQVKMFKLLDSEVIKRCTNEGERQVRFYQNKEFTILHQTIINGHYELGLWIAKKHGHLINTRDAYGMNGLQHLARNPLAFKHEVGQCLKPLVSSGNKDKEHATVAEEGNTNEERVIVVEEGEPCCYWPKWEATKKRMNKYESTLELAKLLIAKDTSWKNTESVEEVPILGDLTISSNSFEEEEENIEELPLTQDTSWKKTESVEGVPRQGNQTISFEEKKKNIEEPLTPLFLATKNGNVEIVKEIFKIYPQAVEHIDEEGGTILHMAIKYGHMEVFDMVENKMEVPMRRLIKKVDKQSNSILHMVGEKNAILAKEDKTESPALLLQRNLLLYERIEKICADHFFNHLNIKGQTAKQVFDENNKELHIKAQEWLKNTAQNCTIVAVLIATVAFAAVYTVPGGSKSDTGTPVLLHHTFFVIFTISDVISLTLTLTSVILFLSILTSPFRLNDFKNTLPQQLMLGVTFLIFSVSMMMLAFTATIILMIQKREEWKKIALYAVALLPVGVFAVSYTPLYLSLTNTLKYNLRIIWSFCPKLRFMAKK